MGNAQFLKVIKSKDLTIELRRFCQAFKLTRVFKAGLFLDREVPNAHLIDERFCRVELTSSTCDRTCDLLAVDDEAISRVC